MSNIGYSRVPGFFAGGKNFIPLGTLGRMSDTDARLLRIDSSTLTPDHVQTAMTRWSGNGYCYPVVLVLARNGVGADVETWLGKVESPLPIVRADTILDAIADHSRHPSAAAEKEIGRPADPAALAVPGAGGFVAAARALSALLMRNPPAEGDISLPSSDRPRGYIKTEISTAPRT